MALITRSKKEQKPEGNPSIESLLGMMVDRRRDALYDRVRLKGGIWTPSLMKMFTCPVGRNDPYDPSRVKTWADTNMMTANALLPPHDMLVRRFLFLFQPSCLEADRNAFIASYNWDFMIMQKSQASVPVLVSAAVGKPEDIIENWGRGSWMDDKGDRANDSSSNICKLGAGICWDLGEYEDLRRFIAPHAFFTVQLTGEPIRPQADLDFYVFLDGTRDYPVQ